MIQLPATATAPATLPTGCIGEDNSFVMVEADGTLSRGDQVIRDRLIELNTRTMEAMQSAASPSITSTSTPLPGPRSVGVGWGHGGGGSPHCRTIVGQYCLPQHQQQPQQPSPSFSLKDAANSAAAFTPNMPAHCFVPHRPSWGVGGMSSTIPVIRASSLQRPVLGSMQSPEALMDLVCWERFKSWGTSDAAGAVLIVLVICTAGYHVLLGIMY